MDPDAVKSTLSNLAFGNVIAAAARNYQKVTHPSSSLSNVPVPPCAVGSSRYFPELSDVEILANEKAQAASANHDEVDLDELMDDPELEKLHAERIAALKKEAEKREVLKRQGHGEYREITEGDFLGEVTGSEKVICHFYHREFYRCKIMDKHLKALAPVYVGTKFIKLDAEQLAAECPVLCCQTGNQNIALRYIVQGIAVDRLVGFQDLGNKDDFSTRTLENILKIKGIIDEKKKDDDEDDEGDTSKNRRIRSSTFQDSDSD
ncbi:hypothetical protein PR202_ga22421 [Eleusine coracana subsp. coracana]|uniref:Thioredoxin domain-containing protein n=1 Tax=Eleusine coracana subsp. coracana TaxID=191504 RepID=A0AAV5D335_ELECO|nr:hypothetical protein PR202_ga22421 [Eleusine coracana subsp. coracana]